MLVLLDHFLGIGLSLGGLLQLEFLIPNLILLLLNDLSQVGAKILISAHIHRYATDHRLDLSLEILNRGVFSTELQSEGPDLCG